MMAKKSFTFKAISTVMSAVVGLSLTMAAGLSMTASAASASGNPLQITINSQNQFVVNNGTQQIWMNGANTPWDNWDDFGGNYDASWWDNEFAQLHANGVNCTRVWIDCDNAQNAIQVSSNGTVTGTSSSFWTDLDSFFALAQEHQIYIMATLSSFDCFASSENPQAAAWTNMIESTSGINSFVNNYTIPFVQRYGSNPYLWSIDVCNEPDWLYETDGIPWSDISNYIARNAAAIHENSSVLVTAGMAMPKYASSTGSNNVGNYISDSYLQSLDKDSNAYLDFYAMHYYDWMQPYWGNPFYMTPTAYGLDGTKPAVISECPANGTAGNTLLSDYQGAMQNGWQGAMAWSSNGVDTNGGFAQLIQGTAPMAQEYPSLIFPSSTGGSTSPTTGGSTTSSSSPALTLTGAVPDTIAAYEGGPIIRAQDTASAGNQIYTYEDSTMQSMFSDYGTLQIAYTGTAPQIFIGNMSWTNLTGVLTPASDTGSVQTYNMSSIVSALQANGYTAANAEIVLLNYIASTTITSITLGSASTTTAPAGPAVVSTYPWAGSVSTTGFNDIHFTPAGTADSSCLINFQLSFPTITSSTVITMTYNASGAVPALVLQDSTFASWDMVTGTVKTAGTVTFSGSAIISAVNGDANMKGNLGDIGAICVGPQSYSGTVTLTGVALTGLS